MLLSGLLDGKDPFFVVRILVVLGHLLDAEDKRGHNHEDLMGDVVFHVLQTLNAYVLNSYLGS